MTASSSTATQQHQAQQLHQQQQQLQQKLHQQLQQQQQQIQKQQLHNKQRKAAAAVVAVKSNRSKHGRKLSNRQDLKNLLVMRPPPIGQSQTWRYVYHPPPTMARHQFYHRKPPLVPVLKTRTVPVILHIQQRSDD